MCMCCHVVQACLEAGESCICTTGWSGDSCDDDTDECATNNGACGTGADCHNLDGSFWCQCAPGWAGPDSMGRGAQCTDVNECARNNGGCEYSCINIGGGRRCECDERSGYILGSNGRSCEAWCGGNCHSGGSCLDPGARTPCSAGYATIMHRQGSCIIGRMLILQSYSFVSATQGVSALAARAMPASSVRGGKKSEQSLPGTHSTSV